MHVGTNHCCTADIFLLRSLPGNFRFPCLFAVAAFAFDLPSAAGLSLAACTPLLSEKRTRRTAVSCNTFAFLGYFLDVAVTLLTRASKELCLISWTYFLSGLLILILNRLCKIYASGHAAGVSMAICLPAALNHPEVLLVSVPLLFIVAWASVAAKRHTVQQYIIGALIPPMAMGLVQFVLYK